jgi:hypothetical protein
MLHKNYKPYFKSVKKKKQKNLNIFNNGNFLKNVQQIFTQLAIKVKIS